MVEGYFEREVWLNANQRISELISLLISLGLLPTNWDPRFHVVFFMVFRDGKDSNRYLKQRKDDIFE